MGVLYFRLVSQPNLVLQFMIFILSAIGVFVFFIYKRLITDVESCSGDSNFYPVLQSLPRS